MMALPLTPCHLLAIAHTLAVPIISLNNKVDYSVFCKILYRFKINTTTNPFLLQSHQLPFLGAFWALE